MIGLGLCFFAFAVTIIAAKRSMVAGLCVMLAIGYVYGILRANYLEPLTHFVFDASVLGVYAARLFTPITGQQRARFAPIRGWLIALIGWPVLLTLVPVQDPMIQLVGLRANVFFLPFMLIGGRLSDDELIQLALWIAALNIAAFALATVEFFIGIEPFFPRNTVTEIMYRSKDIAAMTAFRIPSSFSSAHAYAGTTVLTLPLLLGGWLAGGHGRGTRALLATGTACTTLGVFMAGARLPVVILFLVAGAAVFSGRVGIGRRVAGVTLLVLVGLAVARDVRLQRFATLQDTDFVTERVTGSVNAGFFDLVKKYPLGNGMGGGGTSIPYFLQNRLRQTVGMENEYARIVAEQGVPGLLIWLAFMLWLLTRRVSITSSPLSLARRLALVACAAEFGSGLIGTGLFTSVPQTVLMLVYMGWVAVPSRQPSPRSEAQRVTPPERALVPRYG
jgi:hypothetical protein